MRDANSLWRELASRRLVSGEPPATPEQQARVIRVLQGFAGWVASLFLLVFFGLALGDVIDNAAGSLTLGALCIAAAAVTFAATSSQHNFLQQALMPISLVGQALILIGIGFLSDWEVTAIAACLGVLQLVLAWWLDYAPHRTLMILFASVSLMVLMHEADAPSLALALMAPVATALWLTEHHWGQWRERLAPVTTGLSVALLGVAVWLQMAASWAGEDTARLSWFAALTTTALLVWLAHIVVRDDLSDLRGKPWHWLIFAAIVGAIISLAMPGAGAALLIALLAFRAERQWLVLLASVTFVVLAFHYYYALNTTLLVKSGLLVASGSVLLGACWLAGRLGRLPAAEWVTALARPSGSRMALLASVLLVLGLVGNDIASKERWLARGDVVLLELAPVDPRSLMQGDFMRLRFAASQFIAAESRDTPARDGYLVVRLDAQRVATPLRVVDDDGAALADNELAIRFRHRHGRLQFATNAFFFQEGKAAEFDAARYGEFRVNRDGELLLNALRDAQLEVLGLNRPGG